MPWLMDNRNKIYLYAGTYGDKMKFTTHDGSIFGFRAWGNEKEPKFIIKKLVDMYGPKEWYEIYEKFNNALLAVSKMENFNKPTACITLYRRKDFYDDEE